MFRPFFKILFLCSFLWSGVLWADNVILMVGDGMGAQHIRCVQQTKTLFPDKMPLSGEIKTSSADNEVTDSAAAATAYSCGIKTNNGYLGVDSNKKPCLTLAEKAVEKGFFVAGRTTDLLTGATPAAFYAHTPNRRDKKAISQSLASVSDKMDFSTALLSIERSTKEVLNVVSKKNQPFFVLIEAAGIDWASHRKDYKKMQKELLDFNQAVLYALDFAEKRKDTTVIVLADHETGGLSQTCEFTTPKHTAANVAYFVGGSRQEVFKKSEVLENTDIHAKIEQILFDEE